MDLSVSRACGLEKRLSYLTISCLLAGKCEEQEHDQTVPVANAAFHPVSRSRGAHACQTWGGCAVTLPLDVSTYAFRIDNQHAAMLSGTWKDLGAVRELVPSQSPVPAVISAQEGLSAADWKQDIMHASWCVWSGCECRR